MISADPAEYGGTSNISKTFPRHRRSLRQNTLHGLVADQDENLVTAKMDWQISDKNSFFGRYMSGET